MQQSEKLFGLFPLQVLLLPGEKIQLHIFEPRYKQLIQDVTAQKTFFGILYTADGIEKKVGSLVQVKEINQVYPDGRMDITIYCLYNFYLTQFLPHYPEKLYSGGFVTLITPPKKPSSAKLKEAIKAYQRAIELPEDDEQLGLNGIAMLCCITTLDKLDFVLLCDNYKKCELFLVNALTVKMSILQQEDQKTDFFHFN